MLLVNNGPIEAAYSYSPLLRYVTMRFTPAGQLRSFDPSMRSSWRRREEELDHRSRTKPPTNFDGHRTRSRAGSARLAASRSMEPASLPHPGQVPRGTRWAKAEASIMFPNVETMSVEVSAQCQHKLHPATLGGRRSAQEVDELTLLACVPAHREELFELVDNEQ